MAIKFLDLKRQYLSIKDEIETAISSVVESGAFAGLYFCSNLKYFI